MKVTAIVVAAGRGTRFKSPTLKPFALLSGKPLITHCLTVFQQSPNITAVVIAAHPDFIDRFARVTRRFRKVSAIVPGGKTRADSVKLALAEVDPSTDVVLVHDAARPFIHQDMIKRLINALKTNASAICAVPVKATIKEVNPTTMRVMATLRRDLLWDVQTPQGFKMDVLLRAHARPYQGQATDDAVLVEAMGLKVKVVRGDERNIKITSPEDLIIAKGLART